MIGKERHKKRNFNNILQQNWKPKFSIEVSKINSELSINLPDLKRDRNREKPQKITGSAYKLQKQEILQELTENKTPEGVKILKQKQIKTKKKQQMRIG